jgi:hypothetical protein
MIHRMCGAETLCLETGGLRAAPTFQAPVRMVSHPLRGLACAAVALQSPSTASPPGCPSGPRLGGTFPSTRFTGGTRPVPTGSHPARRLNAWLSARGAEVPPHRYHKVRTSTLPVHGAREGVASSWLRLVRSRPAHTAIGACKPPAQAVGYLTQERIHEFYLLQANCHLSLRLLVRIG